MSPVSLLVVALGGSLGAVTRYGISRLWGLAAPKLEFPFPTLFVNVTGSALLGAMFGLMEPDMTSLLEAPLLLFAGVGFCGAYTTFSSFCTETVTLIPKSGWLALAYVVASIAGSIAGFVGVFLLVG